MFHAAGVRAATNLTFSVEIRAKTRPIGRAGPVSRRSHTLRGVALLLKPLLSLVKRYRAVARLEQCECPRLTT